MAAVLGGCPGSFTVRAEPEPGIACQRLVCTLGCAGGVGAAVCHSLALCWQGYSHTCSPLGKIRHCVRWGRHPEAWGEGAEEVDKVLLSMVGSKAQTWGPSAQAESLRKSLGS